MEEIIYRFRWQIAVLALGLSALGGGILLSSNQLFQNHEVEILETASEAGEFVVEISGAVENPGVYQLSAGSRVEDLLIAGGGLTAKADRDWLEKNLNRAGKLTDGQKIYIPKTGEQSLGTSAKDSGGGTAISNQITGDLGKMININTASAADLDTLSGIGPKTAQNIIEGRPYSSVEELLTRKIVNTSVFEKIKNQISVY